MIAAAILTSFFAVSFALPTNAAGVRMVRHVNVDGLERRYILWLPDRYRQKAALPVVLAFHGGFMVPEGFEELTELHEAPEARNFIIVYPEGYRHFWNEGGGCCGPAIEAHVDDARFVHVMLNDIATVAPIDRRRVYATGYSNGAGLSYYLACVLSNEITAISPVSGAMREPEAQCHPTHPVPVLHWHGMQDHASPYNGGESTAKMVAIPQSVPAGIGIWRRIDGTQTEAHESIYGGTADCDIYGGGRDGSVVELCRVLQMGHRWPGSQPSPRTERGDQVIARFVGQLGPFSPTTDANDSMLKFFMRFAIPTS